MPDAALGALVFLHSLGAAVWLGGAVTLALVNRALRQRMGDEARRDLVRHIGRASAPVLWAAFLLAAATGLGLWWLTGLAAPPMALAKVALALVAAAAMAAHVRLGAREGARPARAAALGMATLAAGLLLVFLGAGLRQM